MRIRTPLESLSKAMVCTRRCDIIRLIAAQEGQQQRRNRRDTESQNRSTELLREEPAEKAPPNHDQGR